MKNTAIDTSKGSFSLQDIMTLNAQNYNRILAISTYAESATDEAKIKKAQVIVTKLAARICKMNKTVEEAMFMLSNQMRYWEQAAEAVCFEDEFNAYFPEAQEIEPEPETEPETEPEPKKKGKVKSIKK